MATTADKRFYQLTLAIQKAINSVETPVKEKHVRSTIIGTFQEQSAITYWMVALRQPLQENRIVAWKFCHVTHKILREGHPACLDDSQRHITMIENLGKLWVHLREGYGKLVHLYCNLLVCKLKFHARNPRFPGHMQLTADELDAVAENDVNNYFQLCVELFDYMDEILNLQAAVFDSLGNARANSMTASGQCRLAALIPCAQDASQIYDCNVRLLFRLHASLPPDTLNGHRERFRQQFKKLGSFYKHASSLQYYRNLLTLPVLPSNPPNFLLQSDFGTYVTPVVSVPEPADEPDSTLIDTSDTTSRSPSVDLLDTDRSVTESPQPDPLLERDRLIDHLQHELKRMRSEVSHMVQERNSMVESMKEYSARLEKQLQDARKGLDEEKQKTQTLISETPEIKQKLSETEEKAKVVEEKFQKLKGAYTQLREEHIKLIRQKAEVDKLAANLRSTAAQQESAKMALQQQLNDKVKDVELLQQSASSTEEIEAYKTEIANLRTEIEQSRQKDIEIETLKASIETMQIEHKTASTEQEEKITTLRNELKEAIESLSKTVKEKEERDSELMKVKEELIGLREKSGDEYKKALEEKEAAVQQVKEMTEQYQKEKEERGKYINALELDLEILRDKFNNLENTFTFENSKLSEEIVFKNKQFEHEIRQKEIEIKEAVFQVQALQTALETYKANDSKLMAQKNEDLNVLQSKIIELSMLNNTTAALVKELESEKNEFKLKLHDCKIQLDSKQKEIIDLTLTTMEATTNVETLKSEVNSKLQQIAKLEEELIEVQAELEIGKNEFLRMADEHDNLVARYEEDISTKNKELRSLNDEINKIIQEKSALKESEHTLLEKIKSLEADSSKDIADKNKTISETEKENSILKLEIEELRQNMQTEFDKRIVEIETKDGEIQQLQTRLGRAEDQRLSAECELQDLLQHNTALQADIAALHARLEQAQKQLKLKSSNMVSCATEAALSITDNALLALDRSSALDNNQVAAELAAKAFSQLAEFTAVEGNEEPVSLAAIYSAHHTHSLAHYIAELANVATDIALSERLSAQSRNLLLSTKRCLERLSSGEISAESCDEARELVRRAIGSLAAADGAAAARSVDDELADMDRAIEHALAQIESLLAASKAGDTGIKLEVNSKILDACTTLMGAVKILVQDARRLQSELGDVKARQKMYRRNPQWSEGLISAAKAVVLAAKMLVSSADASVCGGGRAEGVSAAAHEVAAATAALVAASRARAPPAAPALAALTAASRHVAAATAALVAAVRAAAALTHEHEALDTSALTLTATRRLEMESKIRALELESALDAERTRLAALRKRHYHLQENGNIQNGNEEN